MKEEKIFPLSKFDCELIGKWLEHYKEKNSRDGFAFNLFPDEKNLAQKINQAGESKTYIRAEVEIIKTWMSASLFSNYLSKPTIFGTEKLLYEKINEFSGIKKQSD